VKRATAPWSLLLCLSLAARAGATDGLIEINAARAAAGGVTPGDAPGFPVEIHTRGNFRLTGDLAVPAGINAGIIVFAAGTQIDLNGFTISSTTTCTGTPLACSPSGTGVGIDGSPAESVVVRNGRVTGFGVYGVLLSAGSSAEKLRVDNNAVGGISVDASSEVTRNIVRRNGSSGITAGDDDRIAENVVSANAGSGILAGAHAQIAENVVSDNGGPGITAGADSRIGENVSSANSGAGISAPESAFVDRNSVNHNTGGSLAGVRSRRFYLTVASVFGGQALQSCAAGFHMASLFEILDPSRLSYDHERGFATTTPPADLGQGPPTGTLGWVRTGYPMTMTGTAIGSASCNGWTNSSSGGGTAASLESNWDVASQTSSQLATWPWSLMGVACNAFTGLRTWCVED